MNILMLGRWLPASHRNGDGTRELHFARRLAQGHRLTLAFTTDDSNLVGPVAALRTEFEDLEFAVVPRGWKCLTSAVSLATGESCTMTYFRSSALSVRLADRARTSRYDLVHVSASSMIPYALELDPAIPVLMDFGEVDSEWWMQQAAMRSFPGAGFFRTEGTRLRLAETAIARRAARCVVASPQAARTLATFAPWAPTTVIPSGVDPDRFAPALPPPSAPTVVFLSPLEGSGQVDEAAQCLRSLVPAVQTRISDVRFVIATRHALPAARRLERIPGVTLAAPIFDTRPFLLRAAVAVAPLPSRGALQTPIIEAMASAVPVVTTSHAADGIAATHGRHLYLEDSTPSFAQRVIQLLEEPALRHQIGSQGRSLVCAHYTCDAAAARLAETAAAIVPAPFPAPRRPRRSLSPVQGA